MKSSCTTFVFSALLATCIIATSAATAQMSSKPFFTDYPPFLCVGGGFIAMAGITHHAPLIVIPIDAYGIEAPKTFPTGADDVFGMMCSEDQIELLVIDNESRRLIMPLYTVQWHAQSPRTVQLEQSEELNLPKTGPTPAALHFREGSLKWQGRPWAGTTGDWHVWIGDVDRPDRTYELHFVSTDTRGMTKFSVTLLEETFDKTKILKSMPLVYIERSEAGD